MRRAIPLSVLGILVIHALDADVVVSAADAVQFPFEVREAAGIRRRNDVITLRTTRPEIVGHQGGITVRQVGKPIQAQVRRVDWPGEPAEVVVEFIDHYRPFESREYVLELSDGQELDEPAEGLTLKESDEAWQIDSSGVVTWTIRKDLAGLLDFAWKGVDYIADGSAGLTFQDAGGVQKISDRRPTHAAVERAGPMAVGLRFDYDDWPTGANSTVRLEFPRTKSWIHATWEVDGDVSALVQLSAALQLQLDGPEALLDFGAGDFVYATVKQDESAMLQAGPRNRANIPWTVSHGSLAVGGYQELVKSPTDMPTLTVPGWAHVMDDKRCTALAIADFGEGATDVIDVRGDGRLVWNRRYIDDNRAGVRSLEFWLHFVTMPVHIGARTSPRSMQEPLQVRWLEP